MAFLGAGRRVDVYGLKSDVHVGFGISDLGNQSFVVKRGLQQQYDPNFSVLICQAHHRDVTKILVT
jgi:hypothetical protein